jgi:hypothetical protein
MFKYKTVNFFIKTKYAFLVQQFKSTSLSVNPFFNKAFSVHSRRFKKKYRSRFYRNQGDQIERIFDLRVIVCFG